MLFDALAAIAFVPVKSFDLRKIKHLVNSYTKSARGGQPRGLRRARAVLRLIGAADSIDLEGGDSIL
jgi:hypothetical protein